MISSRSRYSRCRRTQSESHDSQQCAVCMVCVKYRKLSRKTRPPIQLHNRLFVSVWLYDDAHMHSVRLFCAFAQRAYQSASVCGIGLQVYSFS